MREVPMVHSQDNDIIASAVEFRRGLMNQADWYVTWISQQRPWEISVMRLPASELVGRAWHHGRNIEYRVSWRAVDDKGQRRVPVLPIWARALAT